MVLKVITLLLEAAKELRAIKEISRLENLLRRRTEKDLLAQARHRPRQASLRNWFDRHVQKLGTLKHSLAPLDIDTASVTDLLSDINQSRTISPKLTRIVKTSFSTSTSKPRWENKHIQDSFKLNRTHRKDIRTKNLPPNGKLRTS